MQQFWQMVQKDLGVHDPQTFLFSILWGAVKIVLFYVLARILIRICIRLMMNVLNHHHIKIDRRRKDTLESLFANVIRYTVYFILIVEILAVFRVNVSALLAGAGIVGVAVGFGAQSLVKDVLTGLFILFEDQYAVGDVVQINGFTGTVKSMGVRLTRVQAWTGEVEVIPNGQVVTVTNYSRTNSTAVVDTSLSYTTDIQKASAIIEDVMMALKHENPDVVVGDVSVLGVQSIANSTVVVRATAICGPNMQYGIQREAQVRIKLALEKAGIQLPYPQTTIRIHRDRDGGGGKDVGTVSTS